VLFACSINVFVGSLERDTICFGILLSWPLVGELGSVKL